MTWRSAPDDEWRFPGRDRARHLRLADAQPVRVAPKRVTARPPLGSVWHACFRVRVYAVMLLVGAWGLVWLGAHWTVELRQAFAALTIGTVVLAELALLYGERHWIELRREPRALVELIWVLIPGGLLAVLLFVSVRSHLF